MPHETPIGVKPNPLIISPYEQDFSEANILPGGARYISTELGLTITTEDGIGLITEGIP